MSDSPDNPQDQTPPPDQQPHGQPSEPLPVERLDFDPVGARLPDGVVQGIFCTGAIVQQGTHEFIIDFIQGVAPPVRLGVRVVMNQQVMFQFAAALKDNIEKYERAYGPVKPMPQLNPQHRPTVREIYKDLRIADNQMSGVYANTVRIGHSPAEFFMDFITRFFPQPAVSARVYFSASQAPRVLQAISAPLEEYRRRMQQPPQDDTAARPE